MTEKINQAIKILNQGGIVVFPTDTAFGVGCRLNRPLSIKKLFKIRKRPPSQPTPVLVSSYDMAKKYWLSPIPDVVRQMAKKYWPGGLTIVYRSKLYLTSPLVRGGEKNIGLRLPDHIITLALIKGVGVPILGPSANFHTRPSPYQFRDLDPDFIKLVDYVLPGKCKTKIASTVVDCSLIPYKIIRQGAVKLKIK